MRHFKLVLTLIRVIFTLLLAANVYFMVRLYGSIKERYMDDVEQCLSRADQIETVDRIVDAGLGGDDDVVWIKLGLQKSDVGDTMDADVLREKDYSQGFRRVDKQLMSQIARVIHDDTYNDKIGEPDRSKLEEAFRRDLAFSGFCPEEVYVVVPGGTLECSSDLWQITYRVNDDTVYYAYISPLTKNILCEMSGVIATSALIALVLTFGFWYLLHVIRRLRTIEEMKDDFTNNMTHELKTPVAIAYAANDSLLQFPDPGDEERTRKYLTAALDQLSKLAGLVENILAMSMERRKNLTMSKENISLRPFLTTVIEQQKLRADKPCEISLECPENAAVEADPTHFSNIVGNLIENSIKYSAEEVTITVRADGNSISVIDNGIGIPEKSLPDIFKKFYRVPHGNRTEVRGYGIGLYYVKTIVEKHGWSISVESKQGKGSTFTIKFKGQ
ncbi:MAG: HAMP domain-containing histidine kinase [Muribaculaceae bacterium]|nr:HAMP domain-containing histidine kinase [Muribaculaceae bacterium]MBP3289286.1 HAMP domain-containing histidine kinase [Muribaculaceae bacterium]